jgi:drug/metabolite transporter (DMT)-like permease
MANIIIALYVLTTSSALIVLKWATQAGSLIRFVEHKLQFNINPYAILGVGLYGTSFLIYTYLISKYDLGYIIPLTTAFVYVVIFTGSFLIFDEKFTILKVAAILLILAGVVLLNIKK